MKLQKNRKSSDHIHILYTVKWNCCSLLESIMKIWNFPLKSHAIKTIFLQWHKKLFAARKKIPYERGMKITSPSRASSPHMNSPLIHRKNLNELKHSNVKAWRHDYLKKKKSISWHSILNKYCKKTFLNARLKNRNWQSQYKSILAFMITRSQHSGSSIKYVTLSYEQGYSCTEIVSRSSSVFPIFQPCI